MEDEYVVEQHIGQRGRDSDEQCDARAADRVEKPEHAPGGNPERRASNTREPERCGQQLDLGFEAERREHQVTRGTGRHKQRCGAERGPQSNPHCLGCAHVAARTERLCGNRLHGRSDPAKNQHGHQNQPLHGGDSRQCGRGDMAYEPHICQVQDDLDCRIRHQGQGEREHRPLINVSVSSSVDSLRWKGSGAAGCFEAGIHGRAGHFRIWRLPGQAEIIGRWQLEKRRAPPAKLAEAARRARPKAPKPNGSAGSWHLAAVPGAWTQRTLRSQWTARRSVRSQLWCEAREAHLLARTASRSEGGL
jgi:hypothetical protein